MMKKTLIYALLSMLPMTNIMAQTPDSHTFDMTKNLDVFNAIYKNLEMMYVDTLNANEVVGTAINSMLKSLDPYTEYYPEEDSEKLQELYTGKFAGIGALIRYNSALQNTVIDEPYEGMPADEAGLKKGDIIVSIDDSLMAGKNTSYVSSHLRGDPGTTFQLVVKRPSTGKKIKMNITRRNIQMPSVAYYGLQDNKIGYLYLRQFTEGCGKEVRKAFVEMKEQGMKGFILDLRSNGGGLEQEAVDIVNIFVPKGKLIVYNRGKMQRSNSEFYTKVEPVDTVMPMVVLVNDMTASSSEITSGALQDLDRAVIMGSRTYGKGLVQITVDLPYNGNMKLTTDKYFIPSGRCIQAIDYKKHKGSYTEHIPDSLTKVFYTANGREVRDGGGITPDIVIKPDSLSNIAYYLSTAGLDSTEVMLNYEIDYIAKHPSVAPPKTFELTEADYAEFKRRVIDSGFKYDPESEKYMKNLIKLAKFEGYYDDAKPEFEALQNKLKHNLEKDLEYHKEGIKQMLESDIIAAYYYQKGALENALRKDKVVKEAYRIVNSPEEYNKILCGEKK